MAELQRLGGHRNLRRRRSLDEKVRHSRGDEAVHVTPQQPDVEEVRRIRIDRLEREANTTPTTASPKTRIPQQKPNMASESRSGLESSRRTSTRKHRDRHESPSEKHRRRRRREIKEDTGGTYVYGEPRDRRERDRERDAPAALIPEVRVLGRNRARSPADRSNNSSESEDEQERRSRKKKERSERAEVIGKRTNDKTTVRIKEKRVRDSSLRPRSRSPAHRDRASTHHTHRKSTPGSPPTTTPRREGESRKLHSETKLPLRRSNTTSSHTPSITHFSSSPTKTRRPSIFGSVFTRGPPPPPPPPPEPEKLVQCLVCLDDVPKSKAPKLKCDHRMCESCLKRVFRLSITDPQHMPPKCCTADHIPLRHVEKIFSRHFKDTWNKKYHEYTTKNRLYCPAKKCGEWIKPEDVHKDENGGGKYGKCKSCKTKVCTICNGKWHGRKECPKDEETNKLLDTAKKSGWQRCYSCRTMVELMEGCNHMKCRCTAEFCMLCGLKWRTCDCPWFNQETIDAERERNMQRPLPLFAGGPNPFADRNARIQEFEDGNRPRLRPFIDPFRNQVLPLEPEMEWDRELHRDRDRQLNFNPEFGAVRRRNLERADEQIASRIRTQERADEDFARQLQDLDVGGGGMWRDRDTYLPPPPLRWYPRRGGDDDYQGGIGDIHGVGNAGDHFMNTDYRRVIPPPSPPPAPPRTIISGTGSGRDRVRDGDFRTGGAYRYAPPSPPVRRGQSVIERRDSRRVRDRGSGSPARSGVRDREERTSVLAGLGRSSDRVGAWRRYVGPGDVPAEGMINLVDRD